MGAEIVPGTPSAFFVECIGISGMVSAFDEFGTHWGISNALAKNPLVADCATTIGMLPHVRGQFALMALSVTAYAFYKYALRPQVKSVFEPPLDLR